MKYYEIELLPNGSVKIIPRLHLPRALTCGQKSTILLRNVIVVGSNSIRQASGEHQLPWVWLVYRDIFEECWVCHVELLEPSVQLGISTTRAAWPSQSEAPISEDLSGFQQMARHGRATAAMSLPSRCREVSVEPQRSDNNIWYYLMLEWQVGAG